MTLPLFPDETRSVHRCHARGCTVAVRPELLMCAPHWMSVPKRIQRAVWAHYRAGQCEDKSVTTEWLQAADAAIGFVARAEGRDLRQVEVAALVAMGLHP